MGPYKRVLSKAREELFMKCPHCNEEIQGVTCPACKKTIPEESRYCLYCGNEIKDEGSRVDDQVDAGHGENDTGVQEKDDFDLENRIPCSDGTCIGIIVNGKCNICGKRLRGKK